MKILRMSPDISLNQLFDVGLSPNDVIAAGEANFKLGPKEEQLIKEQIVYLHDGAYVSPKLQELLLQGPPQFKKNIGG